MAMTKREFSARLLFWLLPWPISKALPRSLRIYYFGPGGGPPPGFYDYWGRPLGFWFDPDNPPSPDQWPDMPDGPWNPYDPYTPGPGGSDPSHPSAPTPPLTEITIECEDIPLRNSRIRAKGADGDTWSQARESPFSFTHFPDEPFHEEMVGFDYNVANDYWYINRTFALFDLTALPAGKTVYSVSLLLYGKRYSALNVSVQKSTQADPFTAPEWDDFTGATFRYIDWIIDADNTFVLNAAGISYIQSVFGSFAKLAVRDYDHDYLNVPPDPCEKYSGAYSVEAASSQVPRLVINYW